MGSYTRGGFYAERIFPWIMDRTDTPELRQERWRTVSEARGRVLEIGIGTGANFSHYGRATRWVVAIEPSAGMNRRARRNLKNAWVPVRLVAAEAERLPFPDGAFDAVIAVLVLCTVPDPGKALAEARRVLAPGGRLLFFEHVRAREPRLERWQHRLQPVWGRLAGGCHLARDTERQIADAGFAIEAIDRFHLPHVPRIVGRMIRGRATGS